MLGARRGVVVLGPADVGPFVPKATWPAGDSVDRGLAEAAERALQERRPLATRTAIAVPVAVEGRVHGVVAIEAAQGALRQLQWGIAWMELHLRRQVSQESAGVQERLMTALDLVATALNEEGFEAACRALVTELALRLNCDRVSLGLVRKGHAHVIAMSHAARFGKRMNLTHAVGAAMDEAIDQKSIIAYPVADDEVLVTRDHQTLGREHGSSSIVTVPFVGASRSFGGALTFERPGDLPFDAAAIELCQSVIVVLSRLLEIKHLNDRPLAARTWDALKEQIKKIVGARHVPRRPSPALMLGARLA